MTREEAIECNKNLKMYMKISDKNQPCKFLEENYIALDMAIEALEQQPCEDCISRQAVLELMGNYDLSMGEVVKAIHALLPVKPMEVNKMPEKEDVISRDCDKCAYYDDGANHDACDGCFADEYEHPNFKPKAQPCNDCISRQAVLDINENHHGQMPNHVNHEIWNEIKALPSVTPKEKTGRWIDTDEWRETVDGFEQWGYFRKCSKCGYVFKFLEIDNYCPNCGRHMVEPQESEEEE